MEAIDGEASGGGGRTGPPSLNKQGTTGPGTESIAVLPNELAAVQSFIAEVVASGLAATSAGPPPPLPAWKVSMIRAVGNVLLTMMAGSVAFADVTHPSQHNNTDGGHKTVQAQASGRREDGGGVLTDGQSLQTATGSWQTATRTEGEPCRCRPMRCVSSAKPSTNASRSRASCVIREWKPFSGHAPLGIEQREHN